MYDRIKYKRRYLIQNIGFTDVLVDLINRLDDEQVEKLHQYVKAEKEICRFIEREGLDICDIECKSEEVLSSILDFMIQHKRQYYRPGRFLSLPDNIIYFVVMVILFLAIN